MKRVIMELIRRVVKELEEFEQALQKPDSEKTCLELYYSTYHPWGIF